MAHNRFQKFPTDTQEIHIHHSFPVCYTRQLFTDGNTTIRRILTEGVPSEPLRCAVCIDAGVTARNPSLVKEITRHFHKESSYLNLCHAPFVLAGGEDSKTGMRIRDDVATIVHNNDLCRTSCVFLVGGGAFLDSAGIAFSQCRGGIPNVNIPTSTLAQSAAGISPLRFTNHGKLKNFSQVTAPPCAVFIDFSLLQTLPFEHHLSGMAEAFKMAIAMDGSFFSFLEKKAKKIRNNDAETVQQVIHKTATLHLDHCRMPVDPLSGKETTPTHVGSWVAHWLESVSGYQLPHGHALSVGIALDACYACHTGHLNEKDFTRILKALVACGLPVWNRFLEGKDKRGEPTLKKGLPMGQSIVVPHGIGALRTLEEVDYNIYGQSIKFLREFTHKDLPQERRLFVIKPWKKVEVERRTQG